MRNLQKELENLIKNLNHKPKLMLHSCCAPCSSYVVDYLKDYFEIYVLYYNPNIAPLDEYNLRRDEVQRLCEHYNVNFICPDWENEKFMELAKGLEKVPEGGERCDLCFELRLLKTAKLAKEYSCEYFTTSLSISPLKNSAKLCEISEKIAEEIGVSYLPSDFKKKEGYKKSVILSSELNFYRQNYCGCLFSKVNL